MREAPPPSPLLRDLEEELEACFGASRRLAVYGSLAPGEANHHVVASLAGEWRDGFVLGELHPTGWGAALGYPAIRLDPQGRRVPVKLLVSDALPAQLERLDDFEGPEYCRKLVPVRDATGVIAVANIYEARVI